MSKTAQRSIRVVAYECRSERGDWAVLCAFIGAASDDEAETALEQHNSWFKDATKDELFRGDFSDLKAGAVDQYEMGKIAGAAASVKDDPLKTVVITIDRRRK